MQNIEKVNGKGLDLQTWMTVLKNSGQYLKKGYVDYF